MIPFVDLNKQYKSNPNSSVVSGPVANHTCDIANVQLQAWTMVGVVLHNREMDVYINGEFDFQKSGKREYTLFSDSNYIDLYDMGYVSLLVKIKKL